MDKRHFEFIVKDFPENSVKKACYVVREYLRCKKYNDSDTCAVTEKEFLESLKILLAFGYANSDKDTLAKTWYCENDCTFNNGMYAFCPGEFQIDGENSILCEHYRDSYNK